MVRSTSIHIKIGDHFSFSIIGLPIIALTRIELPHPNDNVAFVPLRFISVVLYITISMRAFLSGPNEVVGTAQSKARGMYGFVSF